MAASCCKEVSVQVLPSPASGTDWLSLSAARAGAQYTSGPKLTLCHSSFAHQVSCETGSGDTQAEGSTRGSPDSSDISCAPEKPGRHVQVKLPCVLTQLALAEQPAVCRTHSLMSMLQLGPSNLQAKCASGKATAVNSVLSVTSGTCGYARQRRPATNSAGHRKHHHVSG